jgi:hypothetical protein
VRDQSISTRQLALSISTFLSRAYRATCVSSHQPSASAA